MKKTLIATALMTCMASPAFAHDGDQFNFNNHCNVSFNNKLRIDHNAVEVIDQQNSVMRIDNSANVFFDGEKVTLSAAQQAAAREYAEGIREQLPKVADIALEGVKIAGIALEEVSTAFGISGLDAVSDIMDEVATELHGAFYDGDVFVFDESKFDSMDAAFGKEFDEKIERVVEEAMAQSVGSILVAIGSELMSSGGNMSAFEQRMESMGEQIEAKMEKEAVAIEAKAEQLCASFVVLAQQENELQSLLPDSKRYDLFKVKAGYHH